MSIHKTKQGTYQVRWRENGRMLGRNFPRKIDAEQFEAGKKLRIESFPTQAPPPTVKFSEFVDIWFRDYGLVFKKDRSLVLDRQFLRDYILPFWGTRDISQIAKRELSSFQGKLVAEGRLSPKTINLILGLVRKIFKCAVLWEYLKISPADGISDIKLPEQDYDFWVFEERDRFLEWAYVHDYELYEIIAFAVFTGFRRGEVQALQRDCLDFDRKFIVAKRSYCAITRKVNEYTKGKKIRRVPMNDVIYKILEKRMHLPGWHQIFPGDYDHIVERWFKPAQKKALVDPISFHDLRHTFGSHLAMSGVSVFDIQKLMGHSDIRTTMRYMHLAPDHLNGVTQVLLPEIGGYKKIQYAIDAAESGQKSEVFTESSLATSSR